MKGSGMGQRNNIHATGIVVGGRGVLICGPSGSGKSLLALEMMARTGIADKEAILLADDRVDIEIVKNEIYMHTPPVIAGIIELYGRGVIKRPYVKSAIVRLVVEFDETIKRMPELEDFYTNIAGIELPRCPIPHRNATNCAHQIMLIDEALTALAQKNT